MDLALLSTGDIEEVRALLDGRADGDLVGWYDQDHLGAALIAAVEKGRADIVQLLLALGVDVNRIALITAMWGGGMLILCDCSWTKARV